MGIGTRIQYTEVPIAAGNVISDGLWPYSHGFPLIANHRMQNLGTTRTASLVSALRVSFTKLHSFRRVLTDISLDVVMAREVDTPHKFGDKQWLGFEHVTMTPVGRNLIEPSLLSDAEVKWVNDYHAEIWDKTHNFFNEDKLTQKWLERETQPISK